MAGQEATRAIWALQMSLREWEKATTPLAGAQAPHGGQPPPPCWPAIPTDWQIGGGGHADDSAMFHDDDDDDSEDATPTKRAARRPKRQKVSPIQRPSGKKKANIPFAARLEQLKAYRAEHGNLLVPHDYTGYDNLGRCVGRLRQQRKGHYGVKLTAQQIAQLDEIGFVWSAERGQVEGGSRSCEAESLPSPQKSPGHASSKKKSIPFENGSGNSRPTGESTAVCWCRKITWDTTAWVGVWIIIVNSARGILARN